MSPNELTIEGDGVRISALGGGDTFDVTTLTGKGSGAFTSVRESAGAGDTGIIPLPVLGSFRVMDDEDRGCTGEVSADNLSGQCNAHVLGGNFSRWPSLRGNVTAVRAAARASVFGVFGGTWNLTASDGETSCVVTIGGSTLVSECTGRRNGTLHVDVEGDVITGYTSDGLELSAQRR